MFGHRQYGYVQEPDHYNAPYDRDTQAIGRESARMLVEILRRRQGGLMGGQRPGDGSMGRCRSPLLGGHGIGPTLSDYPRYAFPPQMGFGSVMNAGLGSGMRLQFGMGNEMGLSPHMGLGPGVGMVPGRSPLVHLPYGRQRHPLFMYSSPSPLRAHSFLPRQRDAHSPFLRERHSSFAPRNMIHDEEEEYEEDYRILPRRPFGGQDGAQSNRYTPSRSRRRGRQRSMFEESEDEYDDLDDFDDEYDDYDDYDGFESLFPRRIQRRLHY